MKRNIILLLVICLLLTVCLVSCKKLDNNDEQATAETTETPQTQAEGAANAVLILEGKEIQLEQHIPFSEDNQIALDWKGEIGNVQIRIDGQRYNVVVDETGELILEKDGRMYGFWEGELDNAIEAGTGLSVAKFIEAYFAPEEPPAPEEPMESPYIPDDENVSMPDPG